MTETKPAVQSSTIITSAIAFIVSLSAIFGLDITSETQAFLFPVGTALYALYTAFARMYLTDKRIEGVFTNNNKFQLQYLNGNKYMNKFLGSKKQVIDQMGASKERMRIIDTNTLEVIYTNFIEEESND